MDDEVFISVFTLSLAFGWVAFLFSCLPFHGSYVYFFNLHFSFFSLLNHLHAFQGRVATIKWKSARFDEYLLIQLLTFLVCALDITIHGAESSVFLNTDRIHHHPDTEMRKLSVNIPLKQFHNQ